jgi:hypothetical protein
MQGTYIRRAGFAAAFAAGLAILGGLIASSMVSAVTPKPNVSISSLETTVGSHGKVVLGAEGLAEPGLSSWSIDINYDDKLLSVKSCEPLQEHSLCNPAFKDGTIRVVGSNIEGLTGDPHLASIVFTCNETGETNLGVKLNVFADTTIGHPEPIDASTSDAKADCSKEPTATPTPKEPTPTPTPKVDPGDVNCDDDVNPIDATILLQYIASLLDELPCPQNADLNHDGEINAKDALIILQMSAGLI